MVQCDTKGDVFLGTIDTTGNYKDHTYVATQILFFVQKVGANNVVHICTNNALVMSSAACDVMRLNPHMYIQGCAGHCLDLLLEDLAQQDWMKKGDQESTAYMCLPCLSSHIPKVVTRSLHQRAN